ncbi:hypothetical protein Tco_1281248 [Tanacetum coccineum]
MTPRGRSLVSSAVYYEVAPHVVFRCIVIFLGVLQNASKNHLNDDTPMCERHEANYIQFEGYQNQNSRDSYSLQSDYDPNDSEKLLTKLNNDVRNDLEDFKRCVRSMRAVHWKLFARVVRIFKKRTK